MGINAREEALLILNSITKKGAYSNIEIRKRLNNNKLKRSDKALITEIVNGTLRNLIKIDWIINKNINIKPDKVTSDIRNILRCGVYQIMFLDRVPDSAVCNESVELTKKHGNPGAARFVNAVLRNICRSKENIGIKDIDNIVDFLSIDYSHPKWIIELWIKDYGIDFTKELLKSNNETPPLTIRINKLKTSKVEFIGSLKLHNVSFTEGLYNDEAINIKGISSLENMELFKKGLFQVQDESSMLVGRIANPKQGDYIIDVCSAPGGKATHMAEIISNTGKIISRDIFKHKLKLIEDNYKRLGITIVETQLFNATEIDNNMLEKADIVLVDAPCSGLGLLRRKPDLRWNKVKEDIDKLSELQLDILKKASLYVKKSGAIVYSTCTLNNKENIGVIEKFLKEQNDFKLDDIGQYLPKNLYSPNKKDGFLELYPHIHGTDGFFIAKMVKNNS